MASLSFIVLVAILCIGLCEGNTTETTTATPKPTAQSVQPSATGGQPSATGGQPSTTGATGKSTTTPKAKTEKETINGFISGLECSSTCQTEYGQLKGKTVKKDFCGKLDAYKTCLDKKPCSVNEVKKTLEHAQEYCTGSFIQVSIILLLMSIIASLM